jgi:hypothetical protein
MFDQESDNVRFMAGVLCVVVGRMVQPSYLVGFISLMCIAGLCVCTGQAKSCTHGRKLGIASVALNCLFVVGLVQLGLNCFIPIAGLCVRTGQA